MHAIADEPSFLSRVARGGVVLLLGVALAGALFMVLPLLEAIATPPTADLVVTEVGTVEPPPPAPPPEEEPEEEKPQDEPPPTDLAEEAPPLDLSQMELALHPVGGDGWGSAEFAVKLGGPERAAAKGDGGADALFSLAELDQPPRAVYQPSPVKSADLRRKCPAKVVVVFVVQQDGKVSDPKVLSSSDAAFERPALAAVRQWKFEPGKRNGRPVRFRMKVPISF